MLEEVWCPISMVDLGEIVASGFVATSAGPRGFWDMWTLPDKLLIAGASSSALAARISGATDGILAVARDVMSRSKGDDQKSDPCKSIKKVLVQYYDDNEWGQRKKNGIVVNQR